MEVLDGANQECVHASRILVQLAFLCQIIDELITIIISSEKK